MTNDLVKLFPSKRIRWISDNMKTYLSFDFNGSRFDYQVNDPYECRRIIRQVKIDHFLNEIEPLQDE